MQQNTDRKFQRKSIYGIAVILTLIVFTVAVLAINLKLRSAIKQQIINRDSEMIFLLSQVNKSFSGEPFLSAIMSFWDNNENTEGKSVPLSKLQGIIAMQVFDADGNPTSSIPESLNVSTLVAEDLSLLQQHVPVSHFYDAIWLDSLFNDARFILNDTPSPLLEIVVPVFNEQNVSLESIVRYWIDGKSMAGELKELDQHIFIQTAIALGCGYLIIIAILVWAFKQLHNTLEQLKQQTTKLTAANSELVIAAKSSAIGAVSAYLLHGIKSPLTGLQDFITSQTELFDSPESEGLGEWENARESTRRIYHLVQEIIQIIQEEDDPKGYELSLSEMCDLLRQKTGRLARQKKVMLEIPSIPPLVFSNRTGNLIVLILDNLLKNAIEATDSGKNVTLLFNHQSDYLDIDVCDQGAGLPEHIQKELFKPCRSSKPDGNGIGLAISHQLSRHIGADLSLKHSDANGTCFELKVTLNQA